MNDVTVTMPLTEFNRLNKRSEELKKVEKEYIARFDHNESMNMYAIGLVLLLEKFRAMKNDWPQEKKDQRFQEILEKTYGGVIKEKMRLVTDLRTDDWNSILTRHKANLI